MALYKWKVTWNYAYSLFKDDLFTLAPVSFSRDLSVFPLGPMISPMKLISGWPSWGIITLSDTLIIGALEYTISISIQGYISKRIEVVEGRRGGDVKFFFSHVLILDLKPKNSLFSQIQQKQM